MSGPFTLRDQWNHPGIADKTSCKQTLACIKKNADIVFSSSFESSTRLKEVVSSGGYELTSRTVDSDGVIVTAVALWPNGIVGTFTTLVKNTSFVVIDSYSVTYVSPSRTWTITQPTVTRNSNGEITDKPPLVVT